MVGLCIGSWRVNPLRWLSTVNGLCMRLLTAVGCAALYTCTSCCVLQVGLGGSSAAAIEDASPGAAAGQEPEDKLELGEAVQTAEQKAVEVRLRLGGQLAAASSSEGVVLSHWCVRAACMCTCKPPDAIALTAFTVHLLRQTLSPALLSLSICCCCRCPAADVDVLQTLSGALDQLQERLSSTGLKEQAAAVAQGRDSVTGKVHDAAEAVATFVKVGSV